MPVKFSRRMTQPYLKKNKQGKVTGLAKVRRKANPYRRPIRFRQGSVKLNKRSQSVVNNLLKVGVLEAKQAVGVEFNEQALAPRCTNNIQYINFSPTHTAFGTEGNKILNLVTLAQGVASNGYIGKYINVKRAFMRFHIAYPMIDGITSDSLNSFKGMTERHLRVLLVAPKLTSQPEGTLLTTEDSLFLDYKGEDYGLENSTDKPSWEILSAPVNRKNWIVLKDQHYKVSPNRIDTYGSPSSFPPNTNPAFYYQNAQASNVASWNETHSVKQGGASELNINCSVPINKKVEMNTTTHRPENLNMGYRFIVISSIPGMNQADQKTTNIAAYGSNRVLVSSRSFLQYTDS